MSIMSVKDSVQWRSEGPAGPTTAGGPPGRSSRRYPLASGPNKLLAGGPKIVATPLTLWVQDSIYAT